LKDILEHEIRECTNRSGEGIINIRKFIGGRNFMITAALSQMIDQLPNDEYNMVEQYVKSVAEMVSRQNKAKAWEKVKSDLMAAEKSIQEDGTISAKEMRRELRI
jgi:hypothetical protein